MSIRLDDLGAEPEELDELTAAVRTELLDTPVTEVARARTEAPDGARAVDGGTVGELVVAMGASAALLRTVVQVLRAWRERRPERTVELTVGDATLVLGDATAEQQERAVEAFVAAVRRD
ncbi:hypothetical protein [Kitasatospora terrestris]|uniref:Uncharacterized protein n=1 Tax=Kitasatospora terrestris TaxID=258051 RepID=A0ABP9EIR5_9ACTN